LIVCLICLCKCLCLNLLCERALFCVLSPCNVFCLRA
jgi:hypothetical protein